MERFSNLHQCTFNLLLFKLGSYYLFVLQRVNQLCQGLRLYFYHHAKSQFDVTKFSQSPTLNNTKRGTQQFDQNEGHVTYVITMTCETTNFCFSLFVSVYTITTKSVQHTKKYRKVKACYYPPRHQNLNTYIMCMRVSVYFDVSRRINDTVFLITVNESFK